MSKRHDVLLDLDGHRHDLVLEAARLDGGEGAVLALQAELVLRLAADVVLDRQVLGGESHGQVAVDLEGLRARLALGVGVDQHGVARAVAVTGAPQVVGGLAHVLDAAGHHDVGLADHDLGRGVVDGLQARAALAHDGVGGHLDRQTGPQRGHARQVGAVGALLGLAHDDLIDLALLDAGAPDGFLDDDLTQYVGLDVFQAAAQATDRGPHGADYDDLFHRLSTSDRFR